MWKQEGPPSSNCWEFQAHGLHGLLFLGCSCFPGQNHLRVNVAVIEWDLRFTIITNIVMIIAPSQYLHHNPHKCMSYEGRTNSITTIILMSSMMISITFPWMSIIMIMIIIIFIFMSIGPLLIIMISFGDQWSPNNLPAAVKTAPCPATPSTIARASITPSPPRFRFTWQWWCWWWWWWWWWWWLRWWWWRLLEQASLPVLRGLGSPGDDWQ